MPARPLPFSHCPGVSSPDQHLHAPPGPVTRMLGPLQFGCGEPGSEILAESCNERGSSHTSFSAAASPC